MSALQPWPDDTDYEADPGANGPSDENLARIQPSDPTAFLAGLNFGTEFGRRKAQSLLTKGKRKRQQTVRDDEGDDRTFNGHDCQEWATTWAQRAQQLANEGQTVPKIKLAMRVTGLNSKAAVGAIKRGLELNRDQAYWQDTRGRKPKAKL